MNSLYQLVPGVTFSCGEGEFYEKFLTIGTVTPKGIEIKSYQTGQQYLIPYSIAVETRVTVWPYEEMKVLILQ
jgi:hypothetical protein